LPKRSALDPRALGIEQASNQQAPPPSPRPSNGSVASPAFIGIAAAYREFGGSERMVE
jgi:hypothetical protein